MAITNRKGLSSALVRSKLLPGELAVTTDTGELYFCYSAGNVKNVATSEDVQAILDTSPEAYLAIQQAIADLELAPSTLTSLLNTQTDVNNAKKGEATLDGKIGLIDSQLADIAIKYIPRNIATATDFNTALTDGDYLFDPATLNGYIGIGYGKLSVKVHGSTNVFNNAGVIVQIARDNYNQTVTRSKVNEAPWSTWEVLANTDYVGNAVAVKNQTVTNNGANVVDIIIYSGQSNMSGAGDAKLSVTVRQFNGFEFRAITDPTKLYSIIEPFGVNENKVGGINDLAFKTGSMISAFVESYYAITKTPVIAVSASMGGSSITQWQQGGAYLTDALERYNATKTWLQANGYTVRHSYMAWCQGNGDTGITKESYKTYFKAMIDYIVTQGIEKCLVVRVGDLLTNIQGHRPQQAAQTELCQEDANAVMISTKFNLYSTAEYIFDGIVHYNQPALNAVGADAGTNAGIYAKTGIEPYMYDYINNNIYFGKNNSSPDMFGTKMDSLAKIFDTINSYDYKLTPISDAIVSSAGSYATRCGKNVFMNIYCTIDATKITAGAAIPIFTYPKELYPKVMLQGSGFTGGAGAVRFLITGNQIIMICNNPTGASELTGSISYTV